jgi:hypothetical protein
MLSFSELNFMAILLATIAKFMVGGFWFSKLVFGRAWLEEVGHIEEELGSPCKCTDHCYVHLLFSGILISDYISNNGIRFTDIISRYCHNGTGCNNGADGAFVCI